MAECVINSKNIKILLMQLIWYVLKIESLNKNVPTIESKYTNLVQEEKTLHNKL